MRRTLGMPRDSIAAIKLRAVRRAVPVRGASSHTAASDGRRYNPVAVTPGLHAGFMGQATNGSDSSTTPKPAGGRCGRVARRTVQREGVRGVLVRRNGVWSVINEPEVRILEALGCDSAGALDQFNALAETMNAGLLDGPEVRAFNGQLSKLMAAPIEEVPNEWIDQKWMARTAFACVGMSVPSNGNASQWLAWALSARLEDNLVNSTHPGPGWLTMNHPHRHWCWGFRRDTCWIARLPEVFWVRLRSHHEQWLRDAAAASDSRCGPATLRRLARSDNEVVLDLVASHPNTPAAVLRRLALNRGNPELVRLRVAQNRRVPQRLLRRLAQDDTPALRVAVAAHPSTPLSVVEVLSDDHESEVRLQVTRHRQLSPRLVRRLARDCNEDVRVAMAMHPQTPREVLEALAEDRIASVRRATVHLLGAIGSNRRNDRLLLRLAEDRAVTVRQTVARLLPHWRSSGPPPPGMRHSPNPVWAKLASDSNADVRAAIAQNPDTYAHLLATLATDSHKEVRRATAGNPSTPLATLRILARDDARWVRQWVATNTSAPADLFVELLELATSETLRYIKDCIANNPAASPELLRTLAEDDDYNIRDGLAGNPSTPADVLEKLACADECRTRTRVAGNRAAPCTVLAALANDTDRQVRVAAAQTLHNRRHDQLHEFLDAAGNRTDWLRAFLRAVSEVGGFLRDECVDAWDDFRRSWSRRRRNRRASR